MMNSPKSNSDRAYENNNYDPPKLQGLKIPNINDRSAFNSPTSGVAPGDGWKGPIHPRSYDIALADEKGLTDNGVFGEKYFVLQALYRKVLENMLFAKYSLAAYDTAICESDLQFVPNSAEQMDYYQKYSTLSTSYIYLRNNIHIERLSALELTVLESYLMVDSEISENQIANLVSATYMAVLMVDSSGDNFLAGYAGGGGITAPNVSIVFEIGFFSFDNAVGDGYTFVDDLATKIEKELSTEEIPVRIFCE